jgi:hypothetical protein
MKYLTSILIPLLLTFTIFESSIRQNVTDRRLLLKTTNPRFFYGWCSNSFSEKYRQPVLNDRNGFQIFTKLPNDIQGCACYFYLSKSDKRQKRYIMADIWQIAYFVVDGQMQKLKLVSFKDKKLYIYSDGNYSLHVKFTNRILADEENFKIEGYLLLYKGKKLVDKESVIGESEC